MNCTVEGYPVESVEWLHDGVPVLTAQDTRIRLLAPLVLVIGSVGRRDKGMYQCLVRSDKENAQATAELKLGGQRRSRLFFFFTSTPVKSWSLVSSPSRRLFALAVCLYVACFSRIAHDSKSLDVS